MCRYHGWRYALDGRLRAATGFGPAEGFDPLAAVLDWYQMNVGRDNFDFEGSEDQKNFAAWRGESVEGAAQ